MKSAEWFSLVLQTGATVPDEPGLWKEFIKACDSSPAEKVKEMAVWKGLDKVVPFLRGETYTPGDERVFRDAINEFSAAFVACWGEEHVTHYIHILYAHGPWFILEYGSLGVWQCQGMEKSHWRARGNYQKHTSHDGGRKYDWNDEHADEAEMLKKCSLYQLMCFDYRCLLHRRRARAAAALHQVVADEKIKRKAEAKKVWHKWYQACTQDEHLVVHTNIKNARENRAALLAVKRELDRKIAAEIHHLHGLVSAGE